MYVAIRGPPRAIKSDGIWGEFSPCDTFGRLRRFKQPGITMRPTDLEYSPDQPQRRASHREISPSSCYSDTTAALIQPISPKAATRRSSKMDEDTYNMLTGKNSLYLPGTGTSNSVRGPSLMQEGTSRVSSATRIGSCPYSRLGLGEVVLTTIASPHGVPRPVNPASPASPSCDLESPKKQKGKTDVFIRKVSAGGVTYHLEEVLAEGWLQKKGTGHDWLGSRGWKARWARLCMASAEIGVDEGNTNAKAPTSPQDPKQVLASPIVPLLLLYWYPSSATVSTTIVLDSTIVLAVDSEVKSRVNPHRFEVRHATSQENTTLPTVTRTFAAPRNARDAWVYAISQALLTYAKAKDKARKLLVEQQQRTVNLSPRVSPRCVAVAMEEENLWNRVGSLADRAISPLPTRDQVGPPPLSPTGERRVLGERPMRLPRSNSASMVSGTDH